MRAPAPTSLCLAALLLLATPLHGYPSYLGCSRAITPGSRIMGMEVEQPDSVVARLKDTDSGEDVVCGSTVPPGKEYSLSFDPAMERARYIIEAVGGATMSAPMEEACPSRTDTVLSKITLASVEGSVTLQATWTNDYGAVVKSSMPCTYTVEGEPVATPAPSPDVAIIPPPPPKGAYPVLMTDNIPNTVSIAVGASLAAWAARLLLPRLTVLAL